MKKHLFTSLALVALLLGAKSQTTVTVTATGATGSFNSGSVNSAGVKNDGDMINLNAANTATSNAGFAKFNLSSVSIPSNAVVSSVIAYFTTYSTTASGINNNLYGFIGNPAAITGTVLYTNCNTGTSLNASTWAANTVNNNTLNATGVAFINSNITSSLVCIGYSRASTNNYNIYGYGSATAKPALIITYVLPCSGMPSAGSTTASQNAICSAQTVSLGLSGSTMALGLQYQWLMSANGSTWAAIPSATNITTSQSVTATTYYQCAVSCGTLVALSAPITVTLGIPGITYATIPFAEAFDNVWQNRCDIQNVPVTANWASNPTTGNNSWRRQDAGATAAWSSAIGIVAPMGAGCANFHSYDATSGTTGNLDVYVNLGSSSANYGISFYNFNASGTDSLEVLISTNGGGTFVKKGVYKLATSWTKQLITLGSVASPSCVVRFHAISDFGNDDIGLDSLKIYVLPACTLTPVAGTISGSTTTTVNSNYTYTISPAVGNIQWYAGNSPTGPFTAIAGATSATPTITAIGSGTVYYTATASSLGCPTATASLSYPVTIIFAGDNVCSAIPLSMGTSALYNLFGATTQTGEVVPPATGFSNNTGWGNSNLTNSMWFTFVAPASGNVSVQAPTVMNAGANDPQLAVWSASNCANLSGQATPTAPVGVTLIAANDDDANYIAHGGAQFSSYVKALCLTPGATYYIQLDTYVPATSGDATTIVLTDLGAMSPAFTGLASNYCKGAPATTFTATTPGGIFTINTSTTAVTGFTPTTVGTYTVHYMVSNCSQSNSVTTVVASPSVIAIASSTAICSGSSATLTASGAATYSWMPISTTGSVAVVTPTANASYVVVGSNGACMGSATVSVVVNPLPMITISPLSTTVCPGSPTTLMANTNGSVIWSNGASTASTVVSPTVATVYTATTTNFCGSAVTSSTVYVSSTVNVIATTSNSLICSGKSATLTANGASSYTWMPGNLSGTSIVVSPSTTTNYTVLGVSSCGFNTAVVNQMVTSTPTVMVMISSTAICAGSSATLIATGATTYSWMPISVTGSVAIVTPTASAGYVVVGANGACTGTATTSVLVNPMPMITVSPISTTICPASPKTLIASATGAVIWSNGATTATIVVTPTVTTVYTATTTNSCGSAVASSTVYVSSTVNVSAITSNTLLCTGQSATLTANGASTYTWMPGNITGASIVVTPTATANYTLTGTASCGSNATAFTQNVSLCTGINESVNAPLVSVYPNPNYGSITVSLNAEMSANTTINVYDALGKLVISESISSENTTISTAHLNTGVYFYQIVNNKSLVKMGKLIKQ